jgi:hypothetical protein
MPTYRYCLVSEIAVDAPNIQAAEHAIKKQFCDHPAIRSIGSYMGSVKLPSQTRHEPACRVAVAVSSGDIYRRNSS